MLAVTTAYTVIPARDEEALLPKTLAALQVAMDASERHGARVRTVVVADSCRDATALNARAVAREDPRFVVLEARVGAVGAARRLGARHCLEEILRAGAPLETAWLANTDADTVVPSHWLTEQLRLAAAGYDAVLGTVLPDETASVELAALWRSLHGLSEDHHHIFGANLGVRASSYWAAGEFEPVPVHEDKRLVRALRAQGCAVKATDAHRVITSARLRARAPGGFSAYMGQLKKTCDTQSSYNGHNVATPTGST